MVATSKPEVAARRSRPRAAPTTRATSGAGTLLVSRGQTTRTRASACRSRGPASERWAARQRQRLDPLDEVLGHLLDREAEEVLELQRGDHDRDARGEAGGHRVGHELDEAARGAAPPWRRGAAPAISVASTRPPRPNRCGDRREDDHERGGRARDLDARAAEQRRSRPGDDRGVEAVLRAGRPRRWRAPSRAAARRCRPPCRRGGPAKVRGGVAFGERLPQRGGRPRPRGARGLVAAHGRPRDARASSTRVGESGSSRSRAPVACETAFTIAARAARAAASPRAAAPKREKGSPPGRNVTESGRHVDRGDQRPAAERAHAGASLVVEGQPSGERLLERVGEGALHLALRRARVGERPPGHRGRQAGDANDAGLGVHLDLRGGGGERRRGRGRGRGRGHGQRPAGAEAGRADLGEAHRPPRRVAHCPSSTVTSARRRPQQGRPRLADPLAGQAGGLLDRAAGGEVAGAASPDSKGAESVSAAAQTIRAGRAPRGCAAAASAYAASSVPPAAEGPAARVNEPSSSSRSRAAVPAPPSGARGPARDADPAAVAQRAPGGGGSPASRPAAVARPRTAGARRSRGRRPRPGARRAPRGPRRPGPPGARRCRRRKAAASSLEPRGRLVHGALDGERRPGVGAPRGARRRPVRAHRRRPRSGRGGPGRAPARGARRSGGARAAPSPSAPRSTSSLTSSAASRPSTRPRRTATRWAGRPGVVVSSSSALSARRAGRPVRSVTRAHRSSTTSSARPKEPPGHQGPDHTDARGRQGEPVGQDAAHAERGLGRGPHDEAAILVEPGDGQRGLEGDRGGEGQRPLALDHVLRAGEGSLHVAGGGRRPRDDGSPRRPPRPRRRARRGAARARSRRGRPRVGRARAPRRRRPPGGRRRTAARAGGGCPRHPRTGRARPPGGPRRPTASARTTRAWARGERRRARCSVPGSSTSPGERGLAGGAPKAHRPSLGRAGGSEHGRHGPGVARCSGRARRARRGPPPRSGGAPPRAGPARRAPGPACRSRTGRRRPPRTPPAAGAADRPCRALRRSATVRPWARTARVRQDATGRPSSRTAQAPQRPVPQPALTPKMPAPRSRSRSVVRASASARSTRPLTLSSRRPEVK